MTRQAPRWSLLTPHRENHRLQCRNRSGSPAGGHTRAFLKFCVRFPTAAVGDEAPILFYGPLPLLPLARTYAAPASAGPDQARFLELPSSFRTRFSHASLSLRCEILARYSGVNRALSSEFARSSRAFFSLFALCSLGVRRGVSPRYLLAISPLRVLDSSSTVKVRQAALKIFRAAGTALSFLGELKTPVSSSLPGSW